MLLIVTEIEDRVEGYGGLHDHRVELNVVELREADALDLLVLDSLRDDVGHHEIERLGDEAFSAHHALDDLSRGLAGTESGNAHLPDGLPVATLYVRLKVIVVQLDAERDLALLDFTLSYFHT